MSFVDRTEVFRQLVCENCGLSEWPRTHGFVQSSPSSLLIEASGIQKKVDEMGQWMTDHSDQYFGLNLYSSMLGDLSGISEDKRRIWNTDDRCQFENKFLVFVSESSKRLKNMTVLIDSLGESEKHDFVMFQRGVIMSLERDIAELSSRIKSMMKRRSNDECNPTSIPDISQFDCLFHRSSLKRSSQRRIDQLCQKIKVKSMKKHESRIREDDRSDKKKEHSEQGRVEKEEERKVGNLITNMQQSKDSSKKKSNYHSKTDFTQMNDPSLISQSEQITMQEQILFSRENEEMLELMREEKTEAIKAERLSHEIIGMLEIFGEHLTEQEMNIQYIHGAIVDSVENLTLGNKELEKARERGNTTKQWFVAIVLALAFSLLFLDWYKS